MKIISVCAGGNHVTVERDGVTTVVSADELLDPTRKDTADAHELLAYLKSVGVETQEQLKAEADKGVIEPGKGE